jgi:type III secretion system low calcium response chaperone LcrH/SycD
MNNLVSPEEPKQNIGTHIIGELSFLDELREKINGMPGAARFSDAQIEVIYSIAHSLFMQGKIENACGIFQVLLIYRPLDARILVAFGICCKRLGRFDGAIPAFTGALVADPSNLSSAVHLAECLAALGRKEETMTILEPLLKISQLDDSYETLRKRAETLHELLEKS